MVAGFQKIFVPLSLFVNIENQHNRTLCLRGSMKKINKRVSYINGRVDITAMIISLNKVYLVILTYVQIFCHVLL